MHWNGCRNLHNAIYFSYLWGKCDYILIKHSRIPQVFYISMILKGKCWRWCYCCFSWLLFLVRGKSDEKNLFCCLFDAWKTCWWWCWNKCTVLSSIHFGTGKFLTFLIMLILPKYFSPQKYSIHKNKHNGKWWTSELNDK